MLKKIENYYFTDRLTQTFYDWPIEQLITLEPLNARPIGKYKKMLFP